MNDFTHDCFTLQIILTLEAIYINVCVNVKKYEIERKMERNRERERESTKQRRQ